MASLTSARGVSRQHAEFFGCLSTPLDCAVVIAANAILGPLTDGPTGTAIEFMINEPGIDEEKIGLDLNDALIEVEQVANKTYQLPERVRLPSCGLFWNRQLIAIELNVTGNETIDNLLKVLVRFIFNALVSSFECPVIQQVRNMSFFICITCMYHCFLACLFTFILSPQRALFLHISILVWLSLLLFHLHLPTYKPSNKPSNNQTNNFSTPNNS